MSGVVFTVSDESPLYDGFYFCCGSCKAAFEKNAAAVKRARGWSS